MTGADGRPHGADPFESLRGYRPGWLRGDCLAGLTVWAVLVPESLGLSSGMVVNGSLSKTAVNGTAGARTQLSGLVTAALTILTLLFLTGLFQDLPPTPMASARSCSTARRRRSST